MRIRSLMAADAFNVIFQISPLQGPRHWLGKIQ